MVINYNSEVINYNSKNKTIILFDYIFIYYVNYLS